MGLESGSYLQQMLVICGRLGFPGRSYLLNDEICAHFVKYGCLYSYICKAF